MSDTPEKGKPEWWVENEKLREFLGLPEYNPPRFADEVFTHDVIPDLEERFDCEIRQIGVDTDYLDDWEVRVDGETAFMIPRRRDENGNTVYELDSAEFRERIEAWFDEQDT